MRHVIITIILLLLIPLALAEEKVIHHSWHPYQDFFTIGDDYYEVINDHRLGDDEVRLQTLIKRNQASYIITGYADLPDDDALYALAEERCKAEGIYRFCVTNISLSPSKQARSDESGRYRYGTNIKIYEEIPETALLEVTKTFAKTTLFYDEEVKVFVTITNKGTKKATSIAYEETIGEGLLFTNHKDYDQRLPTKLKKTITELYPEQQVAMQYWVKATDYVNSSQVKSTITYDNPDPATTTKDDKITITWPYAAAFSLSQTTLTINDPLTLTYTLTNKENDPLAAVIAITLDQGVIVKDNGGFQRSGNKLLYQGTIDPETIKTLTAQVYSKYTGTYNLSADVELLVNNKEFNNHKEAKYTVKTNTITPSIVLSKEKMRSGEPVTIGFYLKNEDQNNPFINIRGWAGSDFFNETFSKDTLTKNNQETISFKTYHPPTTMFDAVEHVIAIGGTFQTLNAEQQSFYTERTITVIPKNMSILLTKTVTPTTLKRGEEVTVTVDVENVADSGSNFVQANDECDQPLEKSFGSTQGETFLYPGEARQLYIYKVRVPYDYTKDNFTLTSRLTAKGQSLTTVAKTVTVTDPLAPGELPPQQDTKEEPATTDTPSEEPEKTDDEEEPLTSEEQAPPQDDEKKGVISRIINGIADFFANFFS